MALSVPSPNTIYGAILSSLAIECLSSLKALYNSSSTSNDFVITISLNSTFTSPFKTFIDISFNLIVGKLPLFPLPRVSTKSKKPWETNVFIKFFKSSLE